MTPRGAMLLIGALVPLVAANRVRILLWPGVALFIVACAVCVADRFLAPGASRLRLVREHSRIFAPRRPNRVTLTLSVDGARPAGYAASVRDEHPAEVPASVEVQRVHLGGEPITLEYALTPPTRGERAFGRTVVRIDGPLGLATRQ